MDHSANIMVVEDNSRARRALAAYMSLQAGIRVMAEASNGLEAIKLVKRQPPDIILMDLRMPVMDGLEATRAIKKNWPQIKIVALSMYPTYESEALSAGADAFLPKSCTANEMIATIHALIQREQPGNFHRQEKAGNEF